MDAEDLLEIEICCKNTNLLAMETANGWLVLGAGFDFDILQGLQGNDSPFYGKLP